MKLVLAEDRSGQLHGERAFTNDKILVGRDPAVCHYFFSQEEWPMVSRQHAEFTLAAGRCTLRDVNSRFGTFVNGERVSTPVEVRVGTHIQVGTGGPILRVVSIEQSPVAGSEPQDAGQPMETIRDPPGAARAVAQSPLAAQHVTSPPPGPASPPPPKSGPAHLDLVDVGTGQTRRIQLDREVTRLGRDPEGEVVIDADAAVVSRRHAEIKKSDGQFTITDLKSFNGTLVNGQRHCRNGAAVSRRRDSIGSRRAFVAAD